MGGGGCWGGEGGRKGEGKEARMGEGREGREKRMQIAEDNTAMG